MTPFCGVGLDYPVRGLTSLRGSVLVGSPSPPPGGKPSSLHKRRDLGSFIGRSLSHLSIKWMVLAQLLLKLIQCGSSVAQVHFRPDNVPNAYAITFSSPTRILLCYFAPRNVKDHHFQSLVMDKTMSSTVGQIRVGHHF